MKVEQVFTYSYILIITIFIELQYKGKTENALMRLPFKGEYNFRPGYMKPFKVKEWAK